ncbi:branched-subunit amino acid ABC-type transport system permease component [Amycolatopsis lexingtonensis]|uniref:Branched-subunit amino acid ABC-type transport system permease component n=1 Tax=Amycolatopsis lexingtonensis TaxID=218822 RepID=A0ABR9HT61_9PSEU|nr:branched-chain amino acid ABC transporter permease [Amycolatopsis lexingtonensis]MBE1494117.1 branched-subunit amino acid ABC-type transport system permease component [Amycolatopsis lexingtonensis]
MRELQSLFNGIGLGALYALVGLAAAFVLRVTKIMNFAVGGIVVLAGLTAASLAGVPPLPRLVLLLVAGAPVGALVHLVSTRWLASRPGHGQEHDLGGVLVTVALATALQGLGYLLFGSDLRFATPVVPARTLALGGGITVTTGTLLLVAAVVLGGLGSWVVLERSRLGRALRAVSDDPVTARLSGVRVPTMAFLAYALLGVLCFFVGDISAEVVGVTPDNVFHIIVGALFGLVIGGGERIAGPIVGGLVIGIAEAVVNARGGQFTATVVQLGLVLVILLVKPRGLFPDRTSRVVG